jgi:hypothetical protein
MKSDGPDWMDWLHKTRQEMEEERKRRGISEADWLRELRARAEKFSSDRAGQNPPLARDRKPPPAVPGS